MSKVLFVYYTFSHQTGRVVEAMAGALAARGCDVTKARVEFTDRRWTGRLPHVPMRFPAVVIPTLLPAQQLRRTGEIAIPPEAEDGEYDLIVIGSPTWWLTTNMPIRSYLKSRAARRVLDGKPFAAFSVSRRYWKGNMADVRRLGEAAGGRRIDETHFVAAGGQVKSMLSWLAYMKHGEARDRVLGIRMPPPNLQPDYEDQATRFINRVADQALGRSVATAAGSPS